MTVEDQGLTPSRVSDDGRGKSQPNGEHERGSDPWLAERLERALDGFSIDAGGRLYVSIPRELALLIAARLRGMDVSLPVPPRDPPAASDKTREGQ